MQTYVLKYDFGCGHDGPIFVAFNTFGFHCCFFTGRENLNGPTGASAYGIPRNKRKLLPLTLVGTLYPLTSPECVLTTTMDSPMASWNTKTVAIINKLITAQECDVDIVGDIIFLSLRKEDQSYDIRYDITLYTCTTSMTPFQ